MFGAIICDTEDAIRKVVSIGGDSDTLGCITGGIAEAFYQAVSEDMIKQTVRLLPESFLQVLEYMGKNTYYKSCFHNERIIAE